MLAGSAALSSGGKDDPADPYLTTLCYFNALRELGGARRIVDDEVRAHLTSYGTNRVRREPTGAPFANRTLREIQELTSRYSTDQVSEARARLGDPACEKNAVDVALATNMISVGLDIGRLGLMVVQGQPKTAAEYIQATSRVGREAPKPGLVVTLLNIHKPRDRTHYEQFRAFHMSFYRAVEATSVTPFAPRALDRALAATLVAALRHVDPDLTPNKAADQIAGAASAYQRVKDAVEDEDAIRRAGRRRHPKMPGASRRIEGRMDRYRGQADEERRRLRLRERRAGPAPAPGSLRTAAEHGPRTRMVPRRSFDARHRTGGATEDQTARRRLFPVDGSTMADITQNFSQLLLTYGPGAMLDLPEHAVVVAGLQDWRYAGSNWRPVEEERLVALLRQQLGAKLSPSFAGLRHPPMYDEDRHDANAPGVEVRLFPTWFLVDESSASDDDAAPGAAAPGTEKRRRIVEFSDLTVTNAGKLSYKGDAKKAEVNPIRFVGACAKGHLQDIDWRFLAHRNADRSCRKPLFWVERGVSSDPSDISVRCTCGASVTLADLYKPKFLGRLRVPQSLADAAPRWRMTLAAMTCGCCRGRRPTPTSLRPSR